MKRMILFTIMSILLGFSLLQAAPMEILVWAQGGDNDRYRTEGIALAAVVLNQELKIEGRDIQITVKGQQFAGDNSWQKLKQAFALAVEAGKGPQLIVGGHEDIPVWGKSGLIKPVEELIDLETWPFNDVYETLWDVTKWNGKIWGIPQDAESRPFFAWIPHMKAIGYSDAQIAALPAKIKRGEYTLYDVLEDAKKMQDKGLVKKGYGWYPRVSKGGDYWQFYISFGGKLTDASGNLVLDTKALEKYYQFFNDAVFKYGVTRKNHIGTDWSQWYNEVANGKAGLWHGGTWHYARYTGREGLDDFFGKVSFSLIPAGDKSGKANTLTHPLVYLVSKTTSEEQAEMAARLVGIVTEPRYNTLHAIASAHLGITKSQVNVEMYANDQWAVEATSLLQDAFHLPNHTDFAQMDTIVWNGLSASWSGDDPKTAVATVVKEIKATMGDKVTIR